MMARCSSSSPREPVQGHPLGVDEASAAAAAADDDDDDEEDDDEDDDDASTLLLAFFVEREFSSHPSPAAGATAAS